MSNKLRKIIIIATIFLGIVAFAAGMLIGRNATPTKSDDITSFLKENELKTESYLLEQTLVESFEESNCELAKIKINELSEELYKIGKLLEQSNVQKSIGKDNYDLLKRKFHLMQIRSYILFYKMIQNCQVDQDIVLFYFGRNDAASAEQGKILDRIVAEKGMIVYAIEFNYSSDLRFLEKYYGISEQPALVINYETIKQGLTKYEDIITILD